MMDQLLLFWKGNDNVFKNKLNYKILNILMIVATIYLIINTFNWWGTIIEKVFSVALPFFIAFILAYSLYPCVRKLEKLGIRKSISIVFVILIVLCTITLISYITIPLMYNQLGSLSFTIQNVINEISLKFEIDLNDIKETVQLLFSDVIKKMGIYISSGVFSFVSSSIDFITRSVVTIIFSIYLLIDMDKIRKKLKYILRKSNKKIFNYAKMIDIEMCNYLYGLTLSLVIQFFEYSILFLIIGHPNWFLLAILASITTIVPYFGTLITNIIAVVLASTVSLKLFVMTALICLIFPNVDGYIISPKIYGKTNNLKPILAVLAVFIGGTLGGMFGIIMAVPICIFITCTYKFFKKDICAFVKKII